MPIADVYVQVPGASAGEVEKQVATRLEKLLWQVDGVEYVYSMSRPDQAAGHRALLRRRGPRRVAGQAPQQAAEQPRPDPAGGDRLGGQAGRGRRRADRQPDPAIRRPPRDHAPAAGGRGGGRSAAVGGEQFDHHGDRRPAAAAAGRGRPPGAGRARARPAGGRAGPWPGQPVELPAGTLQQRQPRTAGARRHASCRMRRRLAAW